MQWTRVKDIEVLPWKMKHRLTHSHLGQKRRVASLHGQAMSLIEAASKLVNEDDAAMRRKSQAMRVALKEKNPGDCADQTFPIVLEAIRRHTTFILHPNQVIAALAMVKGQMVEMATGEGKTLSTMLTAAAYALHGRSVHVFTSNRYLATRDAELAGEILGRLAIRVDAISDQVPREERPPIYRKPIVYATLAEIAFDWLRDRLNMCDGKPTVITKLDVAVVDEADMIMIDEALTPLILAEATGISLASLYQWAGQVADQLRPKIDYKIEKGTIELETMARKHMRGMKGDHAIMAQNALVQTLRGRHYFKRDVHYVVQDEKIVLVDEKTGRMMPSRRWQDGLYEAVTHREGLEIEETQHTVAKITVQQYLTQYKALCGCSGTMAEAAQEIYRVYGAAMLRVPTHKPCIRKQWRPRAFATRESQFDAAIAEIKRLHEMGRPVLVGTTHVSISMRLSERLKTHGIDHAVLNALEESREAEIVALAGQRGAVTIATNMAGRGTDIKLGEGIAEIGGLHVISLRLHDAGRIDRQLFGRSARQGDPGSCQFILYLQDDILKPHIAKLRRKYLNDQTRGGAEVESGKVHRLWRSQQRRLEKQHLRSRLSLLEHEKRLQGLYGKPPYLADYPPLKRKAVKA